MGIENISVVSWILIAVLGLIAFMVFTRVKGKKEKVIGFKKNNVLGVFVFLAVALFVVQSGFLAGIGLNPLAIGDEVVPQVIVEDTADVQVIAGQCPPGSVEDVTVTFSATDSVTSVATGGTHRYRVNGAPALTVSDAGTTTASAGDTITTLWYNASISGGYFSDVSTVTLACDKGTQTLTRELVQNGTITFQVFNEEGNLITVDENETLAAGDLISLDGNIKGTFERGMPYGGVLVVEFNTTEMDDVTADFGGVETTVPATRVLAATDHKAKAFTIPAIIGNQKLEGTFLLDVDGTIDPTFEDDIDLEIYPNNWFINWDTGGSFDGPSPEDEDEARTITTSHIGTIHVD